MKARCSNNSFLGKVFNSVRQEPNLHNTLPGTTFNGKVLKHIKTVFSSIFGGYTMSNTYFLGLYILSNPPTPSPVIFKHNFFP